MRRIPKGALPVNVDPPGRPARSLVQAQHDLALGLRKLAPTANPAEHARKSHFDACHKPALAEPLHREQRGICVYCEGRVRPDEGTVEHWVALSRDPARALDWKNLYLSCTVADSCDKHKADQSMGTLPLPCDCSYEQHVGFTSGGEIYAKEGPYREALEGVLGTSDEPKVLNLNGRRQRAARAAAIEQLKAQIAGTGRSLPLEQRQAVAAKLLARNPLPAYVGAQVAWVLWETGARPG